MVRRYISQAKLDYVTESRIRRELRALERQVEGVNRTLDALEKSLDDTWDACNALEKDIDDDQKREKARQKEERAAVQAAKGGQAVGAGSYAEKDRQDWHNDDVIFGDV